MYNTHKHKLGSYEVIILDFFFAIVRLKQRGVIFRCRINGLWTTILFPLRFFFSMIDLCNCLWTLFHQSRIILFLNYQNEHILK